MHPSATAPSRCARDVRVALAGAAARAVAATGRRCRLAAQAGQGTVEYVALILLVAGVLAGVVAAGKGMDGADLAKQITGKIKDSIEDVGRSSSGAPGGADR